MSQFSYATVTTVTPDRHHWILLDDPVILSLYATQSAHTHPWTYEDTLVLRARPHPHTVTHGYTCVPLHAYAYCLATYCLSPQPHPRFTLRSLLPRFPVTRQLGFLPNGTNLRAQHYSFIHLLIHACHYYLVIRAVLLSVHI